MSNPTNAATPDDTTGSTADPSADDLDGLTYAEALDELEDLLDDLESSDVDVDRLTEQVARGVRLVRFCRSRLEVVTGEVDGVVAELVSADPGASDGSDDGGPDPEPNSADRELE